MSQVLCLQIDVVTKPAVQFCLEVGEDGFDLFAVGPEPDKVLLHT